MQTEIDFTHRKENNSESQAILEDNRERLSKNCKILLDALMEGKRLSGADVVLNYGMIEYRRRFADLKEAGYNIKTTSNKSGCKTWYMEL